MDIKALPDRGPLQNILLGDTKEQRFFGYHLALPLTVEGSGSTWVNGKGSKKKFISYQCIRQ